MSLAKAPEAMVGELQNVALMFGATSLVCAAGYAAVRLRHTAGVPLLCAGIAVAALGPLGLFADLLFDVSRTASIVIVFVLGVLEMAAAVMIVLAVPQLFRARQDRPVEVEGTA